MTVDVREFVDPEAGLIRGEIFHSQQIYEQELEQVFGRSWLWIAHDRMIPNPGDFIQNYMGEDPVVVARQKDGTVRAFLNQCRHRGMRICRADRGNAKNFMCSFHGWGYDLAGNLTSVSHEPECYPQGIDKTKWGALAVPRLENYKGFIFGCWDAEAPSLIDYLGDMAWYFDAHIDRYDEGLEPIAVHKWVVPGNWKFNAEQPASDSLHAEITHASAIQVMYPQGLQGVDPALLQQGYQYADPFGHATAFAKVNAGLTKEVRNWEETISDQILARVGAERADFARGHANIFPNFMFLENGTMRITHPRGPDEMEIWAWTFVPAAAPDDVKDAIRVDVLRTFSPGGLFEQDDAENWNEEQRIMRGYMARKNPLSYQARLGDVVQDRDRLPGKTTSHVFSDEGARTLYRHWANLMSGRSWPELVEAKRRGEFDA